MTEHEIELLKKIHENIEEGLECCRRIMSMDIVYDSVEKPLNEQYRKNGFEFKTLDDEEIAEKSLFYIDYLHVNGFLSDKDKETAQTRLIKFVRSHIRPIK